MPLARLLHLQASAKIVIPAATVLSVFALSACSFSDGLSDSDVNSNGNSPTTTAGTTASSTDQQTETSQQAGTAQQPEENLPTTLTSDEPFNLTTTGSLGFDDLTEASGLAASRGANTDGTTNEILWTIADSGNQAELFGMSSNGSALVRRTVNVPNRDWEDMAAFSANGVNYLMIADTGDNLNIHSSYPLHVFNEPDSTNITGPIAPRVTFDLVYEDGSHNVEALAVAESDGNLYLITKGDNPGIYSAPLLARLSESGPTNNNQPAATASLVARRIGDLQPPQQTSADSILGMLAGVNLGDVTAMDIDDQNATAWILTYRGIYRLTQAGNSTWEQILTASPELVSRHSLAQAEALTYSPKSGSVFVTSEGRGAPVLRLAR